MNRRRYCPVVLLVLCLCLGATGARAEPMVIVAGPDSPLDSVERADVSALYLNQKSGVGSLRRATPLDLREQDHRSRFYEQVTRRSLSQIRAYWSKLVFTGKGRPPKALDQADLISTLREQPDAIGYLPQSRAKGLKTLLVIAE